MTLINKAMLLKKNASPPEGVLADQQLRKDGLVKLRKQAEQAVHDMPEGQLKVTAFETILTHLLSRDAGKGPQPTASISKPRRKSEEAVPPVPTSLGERVLLLKGESFFTSQRSIAEIRQELKKNGWHYPVTSMSGPLQSLVQKRELRRERVDDGEGRKGWKYSNP